MKYLVCLALVCVGCSDSTTSPSVVLSSSSTPVAVSGPTAGPAPAAGSATVQAIVVTGPTGCLSLADLKALPFSELLWDVRVNDAGPAGLLGFQTMAHHSGKAGCAPTVENPRDRIRLASANPPLPLGPHGAGSYRFAAPVNEWSCGSVQLDLAVRDGSANGLIIAAAMLDLGTDCAPGTPEPPTVPPAEPPGPPATPPTRTPPVDPPAEPVCVNTNDLFVGGWFGVRADVFDLFPGSDRVRVRFEGTIRPEFKNVSLTPVSWKKRTDDQFPQDIDTIGPTIGHTGFFSIEVEGPKHRRQGDVFRCGPPEFSVLDEGTNAILGPRAVWWEQSEPGMLSAAAFRLRGR